MDSSRDVSYFHGLLSQYWVICWGSRVIVVAQVKVERG